MLATGTRIDDRYEVEALIGEGGLAAVYRVRHLELGSVHALKLLTWDRPSLAERLLLEGRIQAQLNHPNIVAVTDIIRFEGKFALLMEYVDNVSLEEHLQQVGALPLETALPLFASVLAGVATAHDSSVLHRDLKPANILLARTPSGIVPKVTDFGIAKVVADEMESNSGTQAGATMGTPGYMAPEQIMDSRGVDARTDVFALGVILYEMLTGGHAFQGKDGIPSIRATLEGDMKPLDEAVPGLPERILAAVSRALKHERDERYTDARAFGEDLLADHPDLVSRLHRPERSGPVTIDTTAPSLVGITTPPPDDPPSTPTPRPNRPTILPHALDVDVDVDDEPEVAVPDERKNRTVVWVVGALVALLLGGTGLAVVLAVVSGSEQVTPEASVDSTVEPVEPVEPVPSSPATTEDASEPTPAPVDGVGDTTDAASEPSAATDADAEPGTTEATADSVVVEDTEPGQDTEDAEPGQDTEGIEPSEDTEGAEDTEGTEPGQDTEGADDTEGTEPGQDTEDTEGAEPDQDTEPLADVSAPDEATPATDVGPGPGGPPIPVPPLRGTWAGTANSLPFELRFIRQDGTVISANAVFLLGSRQRTVRLTGTVTPAGAITLQEDGGSSLQFVGSVAGPKIRGTYTQSGKKKQLSWEATRL